MKGVQMAVILGSLMVGVSAYAETANGVITSLGCHNSDGTCWVTFDGFSSSAYCNHSNNVRWDASTDAGKRWYVTLLAAQAANKYVSLEVSTYSCSNQGYPTFLWGTVF